MIAVLMAILALSLSAIGVAMAAPQAQEAEGEESSTQHQPEQEKAYLGLATTGLGDGIRAALGVPDDVDGVVVTGTVDGSPADEAGMLRGDVVTTANGDAVTGPRELQAIVNGMSPGDELVLGYWRADTDPSLHSVSITLGDRADYERPQAPAWLTHLDRFMSAFPNAIDASFRVQDAEGNVHVYDVTPGSVLSVDAEAGSITIETRLDENATFELVDGSVVLKNGHRAELGDVEEGTRVVVLEIDDAVKAIVIGGFHHRGDIDGTRIESGDVDNAKPNPRKQIVTDFRNHVRELNDGRKADREANRENAEARGEQLRERIAELQERLGEVNDQGDDDDDDSEGDAA
jgi:hypothetical protein